MTALLGRMVRLLFFLAFLAGAAAFVVVEIRALLPDDAEGRAAFEGDVWVVRRGDLEVVRTYRVRLAAKRSAKLRPALRGRGTITYLVDEGTEAKKGDVLARFDSQTFEKRLRNLRVLIDREEATVLDTQVEIQLLATEGVRRVERLRLAWREAQADLQRYEEGELPLEEMKKRSAEEESRVERDRAADKLSNLPALLKKEYVTADRVRAARLILLQKEMTLEKAEHDLQVFLEYTKPLELARRRATVVQAEKDYRTQEKRTEKERKKLAALIQRGKAKKAHLERERSRIRRELEKVIIRSPVDGIVIYGSDEQPWARDRIKVGGRVGRWMILFTVPDLSMLNVKFRVPERDISAFKKGMPVAVDLPSAGLSGVPGTLTKVPEVAVRGDWRSDPRNKEFELTAELSRGDLPVRPGVSGTVRVVTARAEDVLLIPLHAVRTVKEANFVYVVYGTGPAAVLQRTDVVVGRQGTAYVEVTSGLRSGSRVYLGVPPVEQRKAEETEKEKGTGEKKGKGKRKRS